MLNDDTMCDICKTPLTRNTLYKNNKDHKFIVNEYIKDKLLFYKTFKNMKAEWNKCCKSLKDYKIILKKEIK